MRNTLKLLGGMLLCGVVASAAAQTRVAPPAGGTVAERYQHAQAALSEARDKADKAFAERDRVAGEELAFQETLVANAAKLQELEQAAAETASELDRLKDDTVKAQSDLAQDRGALVQVLAMMQRIRADQRAGLVAGPDDALRVWRAELQAGGALKTLYSQSSQLRAQLKKLASLEAATADRQAQARIEQQALQQARAGIERLVEERRTHRTNLETKAQELQQVAEEIGREAGGLKTLMDRIASLRAGTGEASPRIKTVGPGKNVPTTLVRGSLHAPLPGKSVAGDPAGPGLTPGVTAPTGLWFEASGNAEAVAPADSEVVFAGPYQKLGQVLILELAGGYHLALAGLGHLDVHVGDLLLAGEPVGTLPQGKAAPLYMELRRNGKVVDAAPWVSADIGKAKGT
jgi:septal ring factor EnvC (AmiA/AmiB activator)